MADLSGRAVRLLTRRFRAPGRRAVFVLAVLSASGCAGGLSALKQQPAGWEDRLSGNAIVLLGEVHDNAEQHRLRLATLRRAMARGWRPAIAMEQFDADRQADIDRARRERPGDAAYLVAQAAPPSSGWEWLYYGPVVALALEYDLPLIAANLPRATTRRLVQTGYAEALGADRAAELGLTRPVADDWRAAQEQAVDEGHCGALPAAALPGMARAQLARDALMAGLIARHADRGVVLLAGNGHVRRDIGVPRWLRETHHVASDRIWTVGFVEAATTPGIRGAFDAAVVGPAVARADPCEPFLTRRPGPAS